MLFELRNSVPDVSDGWRDARDLLLAGRSRQAWEVAVARRGQPCLETANDYILNVEIARACSVNRTYFALVRRAIRAFPEHPLIRLYHARVLLSRGRHIQGIDFLHECESTLGATHRALWGTELANLYGNTGFEASCQRWLDAVRDEPGIDSPLALYAKSCACEGMRRWNDATRFARECLRAAPDWSRARVHLVHCLLAQGQVEEAQQELAEGRRRGHEESLLDVSQAMLSFSLGRFDEARTLLEAILERWPQADFLRWIRRTLCILLVELGRAAEARDVAAGEEGKLALPAIPDALTGKHCFISLPLVAQNKNQCVPTSVAMAAYPQQHRFYPDVLFREMRGRDGTAIWRMQEWVEDNGFRMVPVQLAKEAIVELLERGIPLIGLLENPFNSHVDVVCGYNEDLDVVYVRDPAHWTPMPWPWDMALPRYELNGGLLAIIEKGRTDTIEVAQKAASEECAALIGLTRAVAQGNRIAAERSYRRIADDSRVSYLRDIHAFAVAISPVAFRRRMELLASDETSNPVARFRALVSLGSRDAQKVLQELLDKDPQERFGSGGTRYLQLLRHMHDGHWQEAQKLVDRLLLSGGGIANFWELKSDILAELGDQRASATALDHAIELEPLRMSYREKALNRAATRLTLVEYLEEFNALLADDPDDKRLLWGRACALQDGPDGRAFEQAAREHIRWFPRDPSGYMKLMHWYLVQGRQDLHDQVLDEARQLLEDVFTPDETVAASTEMEPAQEQVAGDTSELPVSVSGEAAEPESQLPDDPGQLLDLIWTPSEPRRDAAIERMLELEAEGQLHWDQRARLLARRLLLLGQDSDQVDGAPEPLLPQSPPGAAHWFAGVVTDVLTDYEPSIRIALAVNKWLDDVVPDVRRYPDLWFSRVLLLEKSKQIERALTELQQLLERYPAYSSALYRMGVVKYRQQDYQTSREFFEQALQVNPGLPGAMQMLRNVQSVLGDRDGSLKALHMLRRKMPYDFTYLREEVVGLAEDESLEAAKRLLDAVAAEFCPKRLVVLRARVHWSGGDEDEARRLLAGVSIAPDHQDEDLYEDFLQTRMDVALKSDDRQAVLAICEEGLRRWPNSTRLKEIQAEHLVENDPDQSAQLLRDVLCAGEPEAGTAWQYLNLINERADVAARKLVASAPADRQLKLAELFSEVMSHHSLLHWNATYLEWAMDCFPDSDLLRWRLVMHYNINGQATKAIELAKQLYERNPDHPEAARMLGRCLMDQDARKALPYLEKVCEQDRSIEYLFDLARCHHIVGNHGRAQSLHWEILAQNPHYSASLTSLFVLGASRHRLWPYVAPMLERRCGAEDEYFLVAAVKIAISMRRRLPVDWFRVAVQRNTILRTHPGFGDERVCLKKALLAWLAVRRSDGEGVPGLPTGFWDSLAARFYWPRTRWIPRS